MQAPHILHISFIASAKRRSVVSSVPVAALCMLLLCTPLTGCEKIQLQSQIDDLNGQKQKLLETIRDQRAAVEALKERESIQEAELNEYQARVEGYMLDHKMAVAALVAGVGGAGVALDTSNSFSQDAKDVGGTLAAIAAIWALANLDEVSDVLKTLNEADAHVRTMQAQIDQTKSATQQRLLDLQASQGQLTALTRQISDLNTRMGQL